MNTNKNTTQLIDIYATGGTGFSVRMIENYDPEISTAVQDGKDIGNTEFGSIDDEGQYIGDDDEIIDHVREVFDLSQGIRAQVR